jgi:tripartite ATP-independent transporter DctM subunit
MVLISLFILYVLILAKIKPSIAPLPQHVGDATENTSNLGGRVVKSLLPPLILIIAVLGSIFFGVASPTESAAVGAMGAMILAAAHKRLKRDNLQEAMRSTTRMTSMVFVILIGATTFGLVFRGMGGDVLVKEIMTSLPGGEWGFLLVSMLLIFLLGFFLDFIEICFIVVPILAPIAEFLHVDLLWFAVLIAMNLQTSFLTPPFGFSLFYLKAAAPPQINMKHIYGGIMPFVIIQVVALAVILTFPGVALWLPDLMDSMRLK